MFDSVLPFLKDVLLPSLTLVVTIWIAIWQHISKEKQLQFENKQADINASLQKKLAEITEQEFHYKRRVQIQSAYIAMLEVSKKLSSVPKEELEATLLVLQDAYTNVAIAANSSQELFELGHEWVNSYRHSKGEWFSPEERLKSSVKATNAEAKFKRLVGKEVGFDVESAYRSQKRA